MISKKISLLYHLFLCLIAFCTILSPKLMPYFILFLILTLIIGYKLKEFSIIFNKTILILPLFYLIYLVGVLFTNNIEIAFQYLEYKFSFLIFPFIFCFKPRFDLKLNYILTTSLLSVIFLSFFQLYTSFHNYITIKNDITFFLGSSLSSVHHPTYFSVFILFSISTLFYGYIKKWKGYSIYLMIPVLVYLLLYYVMCQSLAALLYLILFFFSFLIFLLYRKIGKIKTSLLMLFFILGSVLLVINLPTVKDDVNRTSQSVSVFLKSPSKYVTKKEGFKSGNEERLVLWVASFQIILEHPFGVGTGNVDDFLRSKLFGYKQGSLALKNFNPHNQFLQTTVEIGIIGLLVLLLFIIQVFRIGLKNKNWFLILLITSLFFNSFFESMLQRQSGIVFYTFWICILLMNEMNIKKETVNTLIDVK